MELLDLAYAAGIVDGEGCLYIYEKGIGRWGKSPEYQMGVNISMADPEAIKQIWQTWGGNLSLRIKKDCRPLFQWRIASKLALAFIKDIYPFLRVKNEHADFCLHFQKELIEKRKNRKGIVGCRLTEKMIWDREKCRNDLRAIIHREKLPEKSLIGLPDHIIRKYREAINGKYN